MAGSKRCALKGRKREKEKEEKRKGKNGDQIRFFLAHLS